VSSALELSREPHVAKATLIAALARALAASSNMEVVETCPDTLPGAGEGAAPDVPFPSIAPVRGCVLRKLPVSRYCSTSARGATDIAGAGDCRAFAQRVLFSVAIPQTGGEAPALNVRAGLEIGLDEGGEAELRRLGREADGELPERSDAGRIDPRNRRQPGG